MPITLYEPFRAVFYTGFYAIFATDAWRAEGLDVRLAAPSAAGGAVPGLLAGEVEMVWSGPMRLMRHHDRDPDCPLIGFAEVVTRDPFFLVGRRPNPAFRFADLQDLRLASVSEAPTPWLCLQDDIRRAGIDPARLDRTPDRTMAENADALRAGEADVIQVFEPFVEELVREGAGHVWYAAASRGPTSYTTLITTRRFAAAHPETVHAATRAVARTQRWLHEGSPAEIATAVADFFPGLPRQVLAACIARYAALGIWGRDPLLPVVGFVRLKSALLSGGFIAGDVPYDGCVDAGFARAVISAS